MDMYYLTDMHGLHGLHDLLIYINGLDHIHEHNRLNYRAKPLFHDVSTLNEDD